MSRNDRPITHDTSEMNVLFVHSALDDYPLTPEEFRVYAHLARRASSGAAYPSIPNIAKACRIHPDTVRKVLSNLLTYQLVEAHERRGQTTLYTLTKFSRWIKRAGVLKIQAAQEAEGKLKRAEKKVKKIMAEQANPPETKGGVPTGVKAATPPKRREGYPPEMEGGDPPETKGDEGNPLRRSIEGGVLDVTGEGPQRGHSPSAPVDGSSPALHSSSGDAPLQTPEAGPVIPSPANLPLPHVPSSPAGTLEQPAPDGVAADAALDASDLTDEDLEAMWGTPTSTEALETVPGGAATGGQAAQAPRGDTLPAVSLTMAALVPVPANELASRPLAAPESEVFKVLREVLGKSMLTYLAETTRTGSLSRELWRKLTAEEVRHVTVIARIEAGTSNENMITLAVRGLDRLIGAVKAPKPEGKPVPAGEQVLGPVDLSHLDPHLLIGARCTANGKLGVVKDVRQNGYIVELDGGDMITLDRFVAGHLKSLKPSTEPLAAATSSADHVVVLAKVGTSYRELATGAVVEVKAMKGASRVLSNGRTLPCYELTNPSRFERLGA